MEQQVLSIEQMQHLQELGVDTNKASMIWGGTKDWQQLYTPRLFEFDVDANYIIETFSLQDMLEMMPRELCFFEEKFILEIYPFLDSWYVRYMPDEKSGLVPYSFHSYKIINAVYQCFCWLAENKFKGGEK
jgi:hypothetical protein